MLLLIPPLLRLRICLAVVTALLLGPAIAVSQADDRLEARPPAASTASAKTETAGVATGSATNIDSRPTTAEAEQTPALDPVFEKVTPTSVADLMAIERHVKKLVDRVTDCTVGIRIGRAAGSGVIVSRDGYVLCAAHVGGRPGRRVTFILPDGREVRGTTLGSNRDLDASLMKITDEGEWPFAEMGKLELVKSGDWCIAVGHPGGFQRNRTPVVRLGRIILARQQVVQTDCVLIGGDSGGPLFDMDGRVVGIHSRIGTSSSWNFHVPISAYHDDWDRLLASDDWGGDDKGTTGAIMGVSGDSHPEGCRITDVAPGLPAHKADIRIDDVITKFDGRSVDGFNGLVELITRKKPGDEVEVDILRGEKSIKKTVKLIGRS
jgi:serine protease Do